MSNLYLESVLRDIDNVKDNKIIFVTIGPSGAGKSTLIHQLKTAFASRNKEISVHSLDDYRMQCNNGRYPSTPDEHVSVNKTAIPLYRDSVLKDVSDYIVLDNTHLKWDPDWQLPMKKAIAEKYDVFVLVPAVSEFFLLSHRSQHLDAHGGGLDALLKMHARWPGHRMHHLLNRRIRHDILAQVVPSKPDSFSVNKMFHVRWGQTGFLYVLDNYLGYVDRDMVLHAVKAGNAMAAESRSYFLRKDSILHMTLIKPRVTNADALKQYAVQLSRTSPIKTVYTGVNTICQDDNVTFFLAVHEQSSLEWKQRLDSVTKRPLMNSDGLHVTLGYRRSDIWNVDKTIHPLCFPLTKDAFSKLPETFEWNWKEPLTKDNLSEEMGLHAAFLRSAKAATSGNVIRVEDVPSGCMQNLGILASHPDVRLKWRQQLLHSNGSAYYSLGIQVFAKYRSDDELYKRFPLFQNAIPRGLTVIFKQTDAETLSYAGIVFPTGKFFGDNDEDDDVCVMTDADMSKMQQGASKYIVTEKENGEMFTLTPVKNLGERKWLIAAGSKNNKFLFYIDTAADAKTNMENVIHVIQTELEKERKTVGTKQQFINVQLRSSEWTTTNLWSEMCYCVFEKLFESMGPDVMERFFFDVYQHGETLCGEFLSYLHPHLVPIAEGRQECVFFATTTYDSDTFECHRPDAMENLARLNKLKDEYGLSVVQTYETTESLNALRRRIMNDRNSEGIVVLKCDGKGKLERRIKLKTLWYVVHRGFREKLRKCITRLSGKSAQAIDVQRLRRVLMETLKAKLAIFQLDTDCNDAKQYEMYIDKLVVYVERESKRDAVALTKKFLYDYPSMINI